MVPGIVGSSMAQISLLIDTQIATFLVTGSVTWLYYADRLMEFPLGVFSIALATVILPGLSAQHAAKEGEQFSGTLDWALRLVVLLASPAAVGMLCFAGPHDGDDPGLWAVQPAGRAEDQLCADGLLLGPAGVQLRQGAGAGLFRAPEHEAAGAHRADLAGRDLIAQRLLVVLPASRMGFANPHILIATSTCIGAALNTVMLWRGLMKEGVLRPSPVWPKFLMRVVVAQTS